MKTRYISLIAIAIAATATAQSTQFTSRPFNKGFDPATMTEAHRPASHPASGAGSGQRDAFYTEDFSGGGIPAGWTTSDDMTPTGQTPVLFQWSDDPAAVTPAAVNHPLILTFNAPGASNGYLWANSDRGLSAAPGSNHLTKLTTTSIDCSGRASVLLTMKSTIGVFDLDASTNCKVRVSTNGTNWTDFAPFPCLTTGDINPPCERFSYNPQSVAVDITSAAAMQSTVYLQFQWQGGWEYYWAIDDLELSAFPDHDLVMNYGYTSQFGDGIEYGRVPETQMPSTVNVGAEIANFGLMDQTNVTVHVSLLDPSATEIGSANTSIPLMHHGDTAVMNEFITMPAFPAVGIYTAQFTVTSDQIDLDENPANNSTFRYFAATWDQYSLDGIGILPDSILSLTAVGTTSFADNTQDVRLMNYYEILNPNVFIGVEVVVGANTQVGSYFIAAVYDTADVQVGQTPTALVESDPRVITQQDLDNGGRAAISFLDPLVLGPGAYYVSANLHQEVGQDISISDDVTVPQPPGASLIYLPIDAQNRFVYSNGNAWAVRLAQFYRPNAIGELPGLEGISLSPNPTAGLLHIRTEASGNMTVEVFNALGAKVRTANFTGNSTSLDLTGNAAGIYSVRISDGKNNTVQRIALQ
ncbi:MAG: T9SS type A sorting domain-containing protein [Flavobacteriales bacterium]|jgi:hypothetical protein|nr:T9SS type A sorting domain-containing protein [Flavobacteriales bacterium]MBK6892505.1 T9SS type A sorting domain-containing protein [Flavobacteriales bacterium]MBK7246643.1 T9SS type A sorting domain-containing protein [Flavobacteriales bacterium]MBK9597678.1 T9SS type A sorting domain-containing protein [Flavobacteriales bacterium]QQS72319.1 MAG: T9SS type A sorting domain-containing protein [Flavobacteriales bacterium]